MNWETLRTLLEIAVIPVIIILMEKRKALQEKNADTQGSVIIKDTADKTEITTLMLQQGHDRYKDLLAQIDRITEELSQVQKQAQRLLVENIHLRNLLGLTQDDTIPGMKVVAEQAIADPTNPLGPEDFIDS
jgi:hypothetical protein